MKKNIWFLGLLVCALALLASCETPTNADKDKWSPVTSLSQLDGTWKFSYSETQTLAEWAESITDYLGNELPPQAQMYLSMISDVKVTTKAEGTLTIDASAQTAERSGTATMTFSGDGSNLIIYGLLNIMSEMPDGVSVDLAKKSIIMDISSEPSPLNSDVITVLLANTQINQNGKKIKISGLSSKDIIATKQ